MVVKIIEENEKMPDPHKAGIKPPIVDPTNMPSQTSDFEFIIKL